MTKLIMLASVLMAGTPQAGTPQIDIAVAERIESKTAKLTLLQADPRLKALCLDTVGFSQEELEGAKASIVEQKVWLYMGPRMITEGKVTGIETGSSPTSPCAVNAFAQFKQAIPVVARNDILWVSSKKIPSQTRRPVLRGVLKKTLQVLPSEMVESCKTPEAASVRGIKEGAFVGLICAEKNSKVSVVVLVPEVGMAKVILVEQSAVLLMDVIDPEQKGKAHLLVMARDLAEGRKIELWRWNQQQMTRVDDAP